MKFEIINPSDACTMYAPDLEVAAVAVSFLGDGKYPLEGLDDAAGQGVPAFLFGGHDEWFSSKFGMSFQDTAEHVLNHRNEELATTLDSVTLRHTRSSMNDIAGRARSLAQAVRRKVSSNVRVERPGTAKARAAENEEHGGEGLCRGGSDRTKG